MRNVRIYGEKPYGVAVVHGGPGALGSVAAVAREISRECGVLEPLQTATTLEGQVVELCETLKTFGDLPITLIGHSWGAWLAYITAARYPTLVKKLILVCSGPFEPKYVKYLDESRMSRMNSREKEEIKLLLEELSSPDSKDKDQKIARLGKLVSKADGFETIVIETEELDRIPAEGNAFQSVWNVAAQLRETGALLKMSKQIKCPVVAIHGDYDPHPAEGVQKPLERLINNFRFYLLEKCGHSPWKEKYASELFYEILRKEIDDTY